MASLLSGVFTQIYPGKRQGNLFGRIAAGISFIPRSVRFVRRDEETKGRFGQMAFYSKGFNALELRCVSFV
ncbi:MAG: hypothetical protein CMI18_03035 [Opitutaceae bacterium]|nr:hypothetical protein [Opitutaceae bacterium]